MKKIRVLVWNEYFHEREQEHIAKVYPEGIHGAIAKMLGRDEQFEINDDRSFESMYQDISKEGLQPVLNDYLYQM